MSEECEPIQADDAERDEPGPLLLSKPDFESATRGAQEHAYHHRARSVGARLRTAAPRIVKHGALQLGWSEAECVEEIDRILLLLDNLSGLDLTLVPRGQLANAHTQLLVFEGKLKPLENQSSDADASKTAGWVVDNGHNHLSGPSQPLFMFGTYVPEQLFADAREATKAAQDAADRVKNLVEETVGAGLAREGKRLAELQESAAESAKAAQEAAENAGMAANAKFFESQAKKHKNAGWWWLVLTGVLAIVTLTIAGLMFDQLLDLSPGDGVDLENDPRFSIAGAAVRVALLSFVAYLVAWSGKNYRAEKHNQILNERRHIALNTLKALTDAAKDDREIRISVIGQATATMFGATSSGYGREEESAAGPLSTVVEKLLTKK